MVVCGDKDDGVEVKRKAMRRNNSDVVNTGLVLLAFLVVFLVVRAVILVEPVLWLRL